MVFSPSGLSLFNSNNNNHEQEKKTLTHTNAHKIWNNAFHFVFTKIKNLFIPLYLSVPFFFVTRSHFLNLVGCLTWQKIFTHCFHLNHLDHANVYAYGGLLNRKREKNATKSTNFQKHVERRTINTQHNNKWFIWFRMEQFHILNRDAYKHTWIHIQ